MIRTQIYLSKSLKDKLQKLAYENKISISEVIRSILNNKINEEENINLINEPKSKYKPKPSSIYDEIRKIGEDHKNEKTPKDLSTNLDKYLYTGKL